MARKNKTEHKTEEDKQITAIKAVIKELESETPDPRLVKIIKDWAVKAQKVITDIDAELISIDAERKAREYVQGLPQ